MGNVRRDSPSFALTTAIASAGVSAMRPLVLTGAVVVSGTRAPLRWAAVEAGKWGRARPGRRLYCDALELVSQDGVGATDRNCRLLP